MGHFQEVHPGQAAAEQNGIDLLLDIPGQQEALGAERPEQDDRDVVDRRSTVGWLARDGVAVRPEDHQADRVELESVARREQLRCPSLEREVGSKGVVCGSGSDHARFEDPADPIALHQPGQAAGMVLVGVAQDQDVDPPVPWGNPGIELDDQAIRIRTAVDQQPPTTVALDEDRVTLANVEHGDVDLAVRPGVWYNWPNDVPSCKGSTS